MRVVLDTNVLISSQISKSGTPAAVVEAWRARRFILISHALQLFELNLASQHPKISARIRRDQFGASINRIKAQAEMPQRLPPVARSADPFDDYLLAIAEAGAADYLVSGDGLGLLALGRHGATRIVSPRAFADELGI